MCTVERRWLGFTFSALFTICSTISLSSIIARTFRGLGGWLCSPLKQVMRSFSELHQMLVLFWEMLLKKKGTDKDVQPVLWIWTQTDPCYAFLWIRFFGKALKIKINIIYKEDLKHKKCMNISSNNCKFIRILK